MSLFRHVLYNEQMNRLQNETLKFHSKHAQGELGKCVKNVTQIVVGSQTI